MVFYLKINRDEPYTFRNLQNWVDAIKEYEGSNNIIIICDSEKLKNDVFKKVVFYEQDNVEFIASYFNNEEMESLVSICQGRFIAAGRAHLTTFFHAKVGGIKEFWNIDADDTCVCLSAARTAQMLKEVERYSCNNQFDILSLDMLASRYRDLPTWTFGVSFVNNRVDWTKEMIQFLDEEKRKEYWKLIENVCAKNMDAYFTYLQYFSSLKIGTFYFENLWFIHYSNDFFKRLVDSGIYHWKDGKLMFPILYYCLNEEKMGSISIGENIIKMDIGIADDEGRDSIEERSFDWRDIFKTGEKISQEQKEKIIQFFKINDK